MQTDNENRHDLVIVHVVVPQNSLPFALVYKTEHHSGEDEYLHAEWPPIDTY